jgi:hypothetical protein
LGLQNAHTARVKKQTAFMKQTTFMFFMRYSLHRLNLRLTAGSGQ